MNGLPELQPLPCVHWGPGFTVALNAWEGRPRAPTRLPCRLQARGRMQPLRHGGTGHQEPSPHRAPHLLQGKPVPPSLGSFFLYSVNISFTFIFLYIAGSKTIPNKFSKSAIMRLRNLIYCLPQHLSMNIRQN